MTVYLIHFDQPYKHARHYTGFCEADDPAERIAEHAAGRGARLLAVIKEAGITWRVARVYPGATRTDERQMKKHSAARRCPLCTPAPRASRTGRTPTDVAPGGAA